MTETISTNLTLDEAVELLTGYDEQVIADRFGDDVENLLGVRPRHAMRAVAVTVLCREKGLDLDAAYDRVMALNMRELNDFYAEGEPEAMPDEPATESGKDAAADD